MRIRKAVIPAAGFGTRFLPITKAQPKEMLPIVDKPVIQYVVEEAVAAGLTDLLMIIGKGKRAIEEHFDRNYDLENALQRKGAVDDLAAIRRISELAHVHFVWQQGMNGLGDAIHHARHHVGDEPFAVLLGDALIDSETPLIGRMMEVFDRVQSPVVSLENVPREKIHRYGIIDGEPMGDGLYRVRDFVEKPDPDRAPSTLAIAGRYIFTPDLFPALRETPRGKNGEVQVTDAMRALVRTRPMYGMEFEGTRYDIGNKLDFIRTNIAFGLKRPDLRGPLTAHLRDVVRRFDA
jgi:UTP--glucose-1-phosphate uridylyltransferase